MNPGSALARRLARGLLPLALLAALWATGCRSPHSHEPERMASVIVTNRSPEQITAAIKEVFEKHDYEAGRSYEDELVFERKGTLMNSLVYGDWYSGGVWERIKVYQREVSPAETAVECDAYMVSEHEDPLFEKQRKRYHKHQGYCQRLLEEVARTAMSTTNAVVPPP
jgi:hypothetical protein